MMEKSKNNLKEFFDLSNKLFFHGNLKSIDFRFISNKKFVCFWNKFSLTLDIGSSFSKEDFFVSFLHELIHLENFEKKIQDVGTNSYHKKVFLEKAINIGFFVIKHKNQGWSMLSLHKPRNVVFENFCIEPKLKNNQKLIEFFTKTDICNLKTKNLQKKSYSFKYVCSCPSHNCIRSGRDPYGNNPFNAKCLICNSKFEFIS